MNATMPLIHHFVSLRCRCRRLSGALFTVFALFAATATKAEAEYSFTLIADSAGPLGSFDFNSPALNAVGTVAFRASLDTGIQGVFSGNGNTITTIAIAPSLSGYLGPPAINRAGTVAFAASPNSGSGDSIFAGNGGPLVTIANTAGQFKDFAAGHSTAINTSGTVAFWASQDAGPAGIFINSGGAVMPVFLNSAPLFADSSIAFNDAGTLAFRKSNGTGIVTVNGGLITTIADSTGPLNYFGSAPSLNGNGTVAFVAGINGSDGGTFGIYTGNGGPLTTIADISGPFSSFGSFNFGHPSINDAGTVAFGAILDAGGGGLFIGDGTATNEVIGSGDALFGSTVTGLSISPTSLNDSGQVAFYYELANGTTGIAIANPVPEPAPALLLALSFGLSLARRTTRKC